ncbi:MAG: TolC family protein [Armatimonadota bacterium]|nr:TolC family protein [Armatimonadota bacterium]MCX7777316.1 TolC family protein [Armatimonadota bacterium]MDW8024367.1 TolC family protein [Armatimonadota bacterium]
MRRRCVENQIAGLKASALSLIALMLLAGHLSAQMSLREAVEIALRQNPQIRASAARVAAAHKGVDFARSQFYPRLDLSASYREQAPDVTFRLPPAIGGAFGEITVVPHSYREFILQLAQPVYTGGKLEAAYRVAKNAAIVAELEHADWELQLIKRVRHAYLNVLEAEAIVDVARAALQRVEELKRVVISMFEAGKVAKFDVLRVEAELAQSYEELVRAQNALELARSAFNTLLARGVDAPAELVRITEPPKYAEELTREDAEAISLKLAMAQRPNLKAALRSVELAEQRVKLAAADRMPSISLATMFRRQTRTGFAAAESKAAMLIIQAPLFDSGRVDAQVEQAKAELRSAMEILSATEKQVALEVRQSLLNWRSAQERLKAATAALEQAEEAYRIAKLRYEAGVGTNVEVLDTQVALTRARTNLVRAFHDLHRSAADFDYAVGKPVEQVLAELSQQ